MRLPTLYIACYMTSTRKSDSHTLPTFVKYELLMQTTPKLKRKLYTATRATKKSYAAAETRV